MTADGQFVRIGVMVFLALAMSCGQVEPFDGYPKDCANYPPTFPIVVSVGPQFSPIERRAIDSAVQEWNTRVSEAVFVVDAAAAERSCGVVRINDVIAYDPTDRIVGQVKFNGCNASIALVEVADQDSLKLIVEHELGHVLGLHHDSDMTSVMYPEYMAGQEIKTEHIEHVMGLVNCGVT